MSTYREQVLLGQNKMLVDRIAELCADIARLHGACPCGETDVDMQVMCIAMQLGLADDYDWIDR